MKNALYVLGSVNAALVVLDIGLAVFDFHHQWWGLMVLASFSAGLCAYAATACYRALTT